MSPTNTVYLISEMEYHTESVVLRFSNMDRPARPRDSSALLPSRVGIASKHNYILPFTWVPGIKLRISCSHGKHFLNCFFYLYFLCFTPYIPIPFISYPCISALCPCNPCPPDNIKEEKIKEVGAEWESHHGSCSETQ